MGFIYQEFNTTPANLVADLKTKILLSSDYTNPIGQVVLATTPLGAKIAVDLAAVAPTVQRFGAAPWRGYAGTSGTDQYTGRNTWYKRVSAGTTAANICHVRVAAGNTLLYWDIEGPYITEPNTDSASWGSVRNCFAVAQVTPYFTTTPSDVIPTVVLAGSGSYTTTDVPQFSSSGSLCHIGRNFSDTQSWVEGHLETLAYQNGRYDVNGVTWSRPIQNPDGNVYLAPYVVFDHAAGIRGRLTDVFNAGVNNVGAFNNMDAVNGLSNGDVVTYGGNTYKCIAPFKSDSQINVGGSFGMIANVTYTTASPLIAVRTA